MTAQTVRGARQPELEAALLLLSKLGVTPEDLISGAVADRTHIPTFAEFIPLVAAAATAGTLKAYGSYWNRVAGQWGSRRLDEPTPLEIEQLGKQIRAGRVERRNGRGGAGAEENFVAAMRSLYRRAVAEGHTTAARNPAAKVAKPKRQASNRRAIKDERLAEINHAAATTGDDPALDSLILRLHEETACRRGGALDLRPTDLDEEQCLIRLREKGQTDRWQPVSPTLMRHLKEHASDRDASPNGRLLRYRSGRQITYRRYDGLWLRIPPLSRREPTRHNRSQRSRPHAHRR